MDPDEITCNRKASTRFLNTFAARHKPYGATETASTRDRISLPGFRDLPVSRQRRVPSPRRIPILCTVKVRSLTVTSRVRGARRELVAGESAVAGQRVLECGLEEKEGSIEGTEKGNG